MKVGVITYDYAHLKTEQLVCCYARDHRISEIKVFALPFKTRKERAVLIPHRPNQTNALQTKCLSELGKVTFQRWTTSQQVGHLVDFFVIGGAEIIDIEFADGKPIVNAHPGIIPTSRGLDSFKWTIFDNDPLGITLHLIDKEVDKGEIINIQHTPVFSQDSIEILARRHYELEIDMLSNVLDVLNQRIPAFGIEKPATCRMSAEFEAQMVRKFDDWKANVIANRKR